MLAMRTASRTPVRCRDGRRGTLMADLVVHQRVHGRWQHQARRRARRMYAITDGVITEVGRVDPGGASGDRRRGSAGHAGMGRHPHPLRRPGHVGSDRGALLVARRHHHRHGELRGRVRARLTAPSRVADLAAGGRRGHPRHRAGRGPDVGLGDLPGVPRLARGEAAHRRRRRPRSPLGPAHLRDG